MGCSETWHQLSASSELEVSGQLLTNPPANATSCLLWDVTWVCLDHLEENGCQGTEGYKIESFFS